MTRHICVASTHSCPPASSSRASQLPPACPPSGPDWVHEIKHDGYQLIARVDNGRTRLFSRRGHDGALPRASMMNVSDRITLTAYTHCYNAARPSGPTAWSHHYCANSVRAPSFLRADHGALRGLLSDRLLTLAVGLSPEPFRLFGQALPGVFRPSFVRLGKLSRSVFCESRRGASPSRRHAPNDLRLAAYTAERGASLFPASLGCDRQSSHAGLVDAAGITSRSRKSLIDDRDRRRRIYQA